MHAYAFLFTIVAALMAFISQAQATMRPTDIENTANALAHQAFTLKDLVKTINSTENAGPLPDVFEEFDNLFDAILADIDLMGNTAIIDNGDDQQEVYEAFSFLVQGLFELMDALTGSAQVFINLDPHNQYKIPAAVKILGGVVDAYFFNMIDLFPSNTSYDPQASNQKGQVDTHFDQAVDAFHLVTATSPAPYSNITSI
ncbi:MAG: hypothetical protein M1819_004169 [Sarea resinae]|nr:MAG: hypothetical protein M1819_004169 [Sarea resinae]